jgi:hypothetical protein
VKLETAKYQTARPKIYVPVYVPGYAPDGSAIEGANPLGHMSKEAAKGAFVPDSNEYYV